MINIRYAIRYLLACCAVGFLVPIGVVLFAPSLAPSPAMGASAMKPAPKEIVRVHQGWGLAFCEEDEWYYGYGCLHIDEMPSNDPRRNMKDFWFININN